LDKNYNSSHLILVEIRQRYKRLGSGSNWFEPGSEDLYFGWTLNWTLGSVQALPWTLNWT